MPELERWVLHRLAELDRIVRDGYAAYDFQGVFRAVFDFATLDLSAFYFDVRKDALYCDGDTPTPPRRADGARPPLRPAHHLARAGAGVHDGGGLAGAAPGRGLLGPPAGLPRDARGLARRRAGRPLGRESATPAAW